jgi:hypothetical protein
MAMARSRSRPGARGDGEREVGMGDGCMARKST